MDQVEIQVLSLEESSFHNLHLVHLIIRLHGVTGIPVIVPLTRVVHDLVDVLLPGHVEHDHLVQAVRLEDLLDYFGRGILDQEDASFIDGRSDEVLVSVQFLSTLLLGFLLLFLSFLSILSLLSLFLFLHLFLHDRPILLLQLPLVLLIPETLLDYTRQ